MSNIREVNEEQTCGYNWNHSVYMDMVIAINHCLLFPHVGGFSLFITSFHFYFSLDTKTLLGCDQLSVALIYFYNGNLNMVPM